MKKKILIDRHSPLLLVDTGQPRNTEVGWVIFGFGHTLIIVLLAEFSAANEEGSSAIILRNGENGVARLADSAAAEFLQGRSFKGLETRIGRDAPSMLEQGRSGIAKGYEDDHK